MNKKRYTVTECAAILDVSQRSVRGYIAAGKLKAEKAGQMYFVDHDELKKFIMGSSGGGSEG